MTGLSNDTVYYLIRSAYNQFQLASSLANAIAGTAIALSSDGSGTQTFTLALSTRTVGDTGGEENHANLTAEIPAHTHSGVVGSSGSGTLSESGAAASPIPALAALLAAAARTTIFSRSLCSRIL